MILEGIQQQTLRAISKGLTPTCVTMSVQTRGHLMEELKKRPSFEGAQKKHPPGLTPDKLIIRDILIHDPKGCPDCMVRSEKPWREHMGLYNLLIVINDSMPVDYVLVSFDRLKEVVDPRSGKVTRVVAG